MRLSEKLLHDSKARSDFLKMIQDHLRKSESGLVFWTNPSDNPSWAGLLMKSRPSGSTGCLEIKFLFSKGPGAGNRGID